MKLKVKLFAGFRVGRFKEKTLEYADTTTVTDIIAALEIPVEELGVLMINGRHAQISRKLVDGDIVSIFPLVGGG